jgi:hypothetical protein
LPCPSRPFSAGAPRFSRVGTVRSCSEGRT